MICKLVCREAGEHVQVEVHMDGVLAGELFLRVGQWQIFGAALGLGADIMNVHFNHFQFEVDFPDQSAVLTRIGEREDDAVAKNSGEQ